MRAGTDRGHALVDERGGVRHDPHDRAPLREARLEVGRRDAGGEADHEVALGHVVVDLGEQAAHVLRLDDEHQGVGERGGLRVGEHPHAVLLGELRGAVSTALGDDELVGRAAGAQQPRQEGLAHDASTEDRNHSHVR